MRSGIVFILALENDWACETQTVKWGRRIGMMTLVCAGALAIVLLLTPSREPVYQGHKLSWWIHQYNEAGRVNNLQRRAEVQSAIQQIGTNAVPTLLDWIRYDEPSWRTHLVDRLQKSGRAFLQKPAVWRLVMGTTGSRARSAIIGFQALGPAAQPAAGELVALSASKSPFVSQNAMMALWTIPGRKAPFLAALLTNSDSTVRIRAAGLLGTVFHSSGFSPDKSPAPAVPFTNTLFSVPPNALGKDGKPALNVVIVPDKDSNSVYWLTNAVH